ITPSFCADVIRCVGIGLEPDGSANGFKIAIATATMRIPDPVMFLGQCTSSNTKLNTVSVTNKKGIGRTIVITVPEITSATAASSAASSIALNIRGGCTSIHGQPGQVGI